MPAETISPASLVLVLAVMSARLGVALMMFPLFAATSLPLSVRGAVMAGLSLCLLPAFGGPAALAQWAAQPGLTLTLLLAKEVALGLVLGLVGSAAFWALHAAGSIIENQAGLSMAATLDPLSGQEDSLVGGFLVQVLSVVFLASGGLLALLGALYESYRVWPIGTLAPALEPTLWLRAAEGVMRATFELALRVAAPFVLLLLLVETALGLLGRHAPQLNVFFLALPLKAALLLAMLLVYTLVLSSGAVTPDVTAAMRALFGAR